jgi:hypothetical protein
MPAGPVEALPESVTSLPLGRVTQCEVAALSGGYRLAMLTARRVSRDDDSPTVGGFGQERRHGFQSSCCAHRGAGRSDARITGPWRVSIWTAVPGALISISVVCVPSNYRNPPAVDDPHQR